MRFIMLTIFVSGFIGVVTSQSVHGQWWGRGYHSSTAFEANTRGMGALIRDQGEANLLNAQAAGELEQARSQYITNTVDAVQAYYDRRRVREAYYAEKKEQRKGELSRFLERKGSITQISGDDIDSKSGEIRWPALLETKAYADFRVPYEELFMKHHKTGLLTGDEFMKLQNISRAWRKQLAADRKKFDTNQVRNSIRYILGLDKVVAGA